MEFLVSTGVARIIKYCDEPYSNPGWLSRSYRETAQWLTRRLESMIQFSRDGWLARGNQSVNGVCHSQRSDTGGARELRSSFFRGASQQVDSPNKSTFLTLSIGRSR